MRRREIPVPAKILPTFRQFLDANAATRVLGFYGGAGSGKSQSVARWLCGKFVNERNKRLLMTRGTMPSLRLTCWYDVLKILREWHIPVQIDKSNFTLRYKDNEWVAKALDDPEKIKSAEFNYIWLEEATELNYEDFLQLDLRLRANPRGGFNQMFCTFNPIDEFNWAVQEFYPSPRRTDAASHHSTHVDNKFLDEHTRRAIENLITQDENYYNVYALGVPGHLKDLIYTGYSVGTPPVGMEPIAYGLDFGYNNPAVLLELSRYGAFGEGLFVRELIYESYLTNAMLIEKMKHLIPKNYRHVTIYADPSEPKDIAEIGSHGFSIKAAENAVYPGIKKVQRIPLTFDEDAVNVIKEARAYKWREDPRTGTVLDEPVKHNDHAMDALRYPVMSCPQIQVQDIKRDPPAKRVTPQGRPKTKIMGMRTGTRPHRL